MSTNLDFLPAETFTHYSLLLAIVIGSLCVTLLWRTIYARRKLPPGPWGLPILGYLPFLGKESFRTLKDLSNKYGNVFSLYYGRTYVVILSDYTAVKEALSREDTTDRPPGIFDSLPDGVGFSSANGQEWVEQRRYNIKVMKNVGLGKSAWVNLIEDEIPEFIELVKSYKGQPMDIFKFLTSSVCSNIASMVFGKRLPFGDPNRELLDRCLDAVPLVLTQVGFWSPFRWLADIIFKFHIGERGKYLSLMQEFNSYIRKEIELHKSHDGSVANDFIDDYLREMEVQKKQNANTTFNERNLVGNTQGLFIGGGDTARTSLNWLLLGMATYPDVQKKVHAELDSFPGQRITWEDRANLPYTYAVLMEGQRWKTIVPLNTSRIAREDIKLCGFDIPKGSVIIANYWAIHNDERCWKEPEKFIPERFLLNEGKEVNLKPENYVAFSYGRRKCPGETIAMMEIFLYFTALMKLFQVRTPSGEKPCLDGTMALVYQPIPQKLCFVPRSPE